MLRACALDFRGSWNEHLPLAEFSYNNSYQSSIKMTPLEALYGRKCRPPVCWFESEGNREFETDYIKDQLRIIDIIKDRLKIAQSRQKSYADQKRRTSEPQVRDTVYLRVSLTKGVKRFRVKGNWVRDTLDHSELWDRKGQCHMSWSYQRYCHKFITYFTYHNYRNA